MRLLLATANRHKVEEIQAILQGFPVELVDLSSFQPVPEPEETGLTYLDNALLKARYYSQALGLPALADDSGLEVDALDGQPGLYSARFAGQETPHSMKILKVLEMLQDVPREERTARFRCAAALVGAGPELTCVGVVEGHIARGPQGQGGFGYDPIFWLEERRCTMAEIPADDKNRISHRTRAFLGLMDQLGLSVTQGR